MMNERRTMLNECEPTAWKKLAISEGRSRREDRTSNKSTVPSTTKPRLRRSCSQSRTDYGCRRQSGQFPVNHGVAPTFGNIGPHSDIRYRQDELFRPYGSTFRH